MAKLGIRITAAAAITAACGWGSLWAQPRTPASAEPSIFGESIDVRVVNVEVVVTNRDGSRVGGLRAEDFRLEVDGKTVPITHFSEVAGGEAVAAQATPSATAPAAAAPGVEPGAAVGTSYLVFVDDFFATQIRRNEVLASLKSDLARLGPRDRMAIVAHDGGRLTMVSNWSQSPDELAAAFDRAMARPARGLDRIVEARRAAGEAELAADARSSGDRPADAAPLDLNERMNTSSLDLQESSYGSTLFRQEEAVVNAAARTLRTFASPPGRKVMLLMVGGWPYSIASFIRGDGPVPLSRTWRDGENLLRNLTSTANLLGYTVYPIDVPGLQTSAADASISQAAGGGSFREQETEGTLQFIAKETGGRPLLNDNRLAAFSQAVADTRSYYWLGFAPSWKGNDARHRVEVRVGKPGLRVRARESFLDLSKPTEVAMMVESALLFGNLPGGVVMPMRLGAMVRGKRGQTEIPITLGLPADVVTLWPVAGKYVAHAELRFAATDESGNGSEITMVPLDISSDRPAKFGGYIKYETVLTLNGKANRLVATVYDPITARIATAEATLALP